jgi:hypothetical protein
VPDRHWFVRSGQRKSRNCQGFIRPGQTGIYVAILSRWGLQMTDPYGKTAKALVSESLSRAPAPLDADLLSTKIAAALRAQARETETMRRDLYQALRHQHCC